MKFPETEKMRKTALAALFALAALLIAFHFTDTPKVWVDEGVFTETAKNIAWHGVSGLQVSPGNFFPMTTLLTTGYPVIFPVAGSIYLFGTGIWQARLPMILYMFALAVVFYLFARKRYGFRAAVLSVLLLLSFSPFYGNGRPVQGEVPGLVFLVLGSLLLLLWEESGFRSRQRAFLAGLAYGLSAATKPTYLFLLGAALVVTLIAYFRKIHSKKAILTCAAGFLLPVLLLIFIQFPNSESLRTIIPTYAHLAANHDPAVSTLSMIRVNFLRFFKESTPLLFSFLLGSILLSLLVRFFKKSEEKLSISEFVIISFVALNWLAYLPGTGWYRYFFPGHALLYLLFPAAIFSLARHVYKPAFKKAIMAIPVLLILFQFYDLALLSDTSFVVNRSRNGDLAAAFANIDSSQSVLFYNTVETIVFFKGSDYSEYLSMGDFLEAGNKNDLTGASQDYILTNADPALPIPPCYDKTPVNAYYLLHKASKCP